MTHALPMQKSQNRFLSSYCFLLFFYEKIFPFKVYDVLLQQKHNMTIFNRNSIRIGMAALLVAVSHTIVAQEVTNQQHQADSLNVDMYFQNLPAVMVTGERPIAKLERGQLSYNMPLLLQRIPADNAFNALENIPGVAVQNDAVSFAGQSVTLIINGKVSTMSYAQVVERLKSMPADRLAKAEVMLSAPARYHVRGAAINIVTKDYTGERHTSGQLQGTYSQSRYAGGQVKGNLLHVNNRLTLDADYSYNYGNSYGEADHEALHPLNGERVPYVDYTTNKTHSISHYYRAGMDYQFDKNHILSLAYTGSWKSYHSNNRTTGSSVSHQSSDGHNYLHNVDFNYTLPFGLQLAAAYTRYEAPKEQMLDGQLNDTERSLTASSNQKIDKWLVTADQQHTLADGWGVSYGAKAQFTNNNSFQTTWNPDGETLSEATSHVDINERIVNAYVGFSKQIGKVFSIDASVTAENYHTPQWNEWRIYPNVNVVWNVNDRHVLNLSFSSDATYPSYWSTMSSVNYSSAYSEIWGNPSLKPASNYDLSLMWQFARRYTLVAFAKFHPDYSVQLPYQPSDRMAVIMKEVNFDHRNTFGLQASAQFRSGKWLNGNIFLTGLYTNDRCDDFFDLPFDRSKFSVIAGGVASVLLSHRTNLRFIVNPFFQSDAIQGVFDIKSMFKLNASLRWASQNGKWSVVVAGQNLTNRRFNTQSVQGNQHFAMKVCQDWATASLSVIYKFGNYKQKQTKEVDTSRMGH